MEGVASRSAPLGALPVRAQSDFVFGDQVAVRCPSAVGIGSIPQFVTLAAVDEMHEVSKTHRACGAGGSGTFGGVFPFLCAGATGQVGGVRVLGKTRRLKGLGGARQALMLLCSVAAGGVHMERGGVHVL